MERVWCLPFLTHNVWYKTNDKIVSETVITVCYGETFKCCKRSQALSVINLQCSHLDENICGVRKNNKTKKTATR